MTRIEEIADAAKEAYPGKKNDLARVAFLDGARWADDHPSKAACDVFRSWHPASEEPEDFEEMIADTDDGACIIYWAHQEDTWQRFVFLCNINRWMYVRDLLPGIAEMKIKNEQNDLT